MSSHLNPQPIHPPSQAKWGGFSYLPVCAGFCRLLAWLVKSHGEPWGAEFHFLSGLTPPWWCSSVRLSVWTIPGPGVGWGVGGGGIPSSPGTIIKAQVMPPSSRLLGWRVAAASTGKAPCPRAEGSKGMKHNTACC